MGHAARAEGALDPLRELSRAAEITGLGAMLRARRRAVVSGVAGSSTVFAAAALSVSLGGPVVLVLAHLDDADEAAEELAGLIDVIHLPALEALPGESSASVELFAQRLAAVRRAQALDAGAPCVLLCPIQALMQRVPSPRRLDALARRLRKGDTVRPADLARWLTEAGYRRADAVEEPGDFAVRGGILDVFPPAAEGGCPVRLDFFGDEIDRITEVDLETMGSDRAIESVELVAAQADAILSDEGTVNFLEVLPAGVVGVLAETAEVVEQGRGYYERATAAGGIIGPPAVLKALQERCAAVAEINQFSTSSAAADARVELPVEPLPPFERESAEAVKELVALAQGGRVVVAVQNEGERARLVELLAPLAGLGNGTGDAAGVEILSRYVHRGFAWRGGGGGGGFALVPYHELLHRFEVRRRGGKLRAARAMDTFLDLKPGDYVVHTEHGIALFVGLELLSAKADRNETAKTGKVPAGLRKKDAIGDDTQEYLTLEFAKGSRLHVPASQIDLVQKYVGGFSGKPPLSGLGGGRWKAQKAKVAESVRDLAAEMLRVRAAREHMPGLQYPGDTAWQREFEEEFPYTETEDQLAALGEIKRDMQSARPMDRLLCGDVGFGKTEVAIRAAFKACEFGKQVAVLVPTTVLAEQHERTFRQRFAAYPFRVESLSRFKTTKEVNDTLAAVRKGQVDVVIGTHRLLSKDVRFADLGLVVIDEEQRFGVEHKERLLQLRMTVDVLTLSATPIPRTLHMSMLGLRDISSLTTPPMDRRAVVSEVIPYNARRVQQAIERELSREGQVYFVHNRVYDIQTMADEIHKLAPGARIVVGHGQMPPGELEEVMLKFMRREADILVATTIIESGIDNPTANTMFINEADKFGLADLHQLRGRVGRYKHRAYCYFLLSPDKTVKEVARKRLRAVEEYSMLGAGFKIAMRDLEIRGAGNILGAEQSGHIATVGYEMYCRLLEDAVHDLKNDREIQPLAHTAIDIGVYGLIPRAYVPSDVRRLEAYRRIAMASSPEELERVRGDIASAYGEPPAAVERLLELARLRIAVARLGVRVVGVRERDVVFLVREAGPVSAALLSHPAAQASEVRVVSAALAETRARALTGEALAEVYFRPPESYLRDRVSLLRALTRRLSVGGEGGAAGGVGAGLLKTSTSDGGTAARRTVPVRRTEGPRAGPGTGEV